jgi:hypothetical protein
MEVAIPALKAKLDSKKRTSRSKSRDDYEKQLKVAWDFGL